MSSSPTVSVCIPTYNRSRYLLDCIKSILRQSFSDYELIIVDDCSTDNTSEVVHKFKDSRIRYLRNDENVGQMMNLNKCLDVATAEFICVFHDDDVYDPQILEKHLRVFSSNERIGLAHTAVWLLTEDGRYGNYTGCPEKTTSGPASMHFWTISALAMILCFRRLWSAVDVMSVSADLIRGT